MASVQRVTQYPGCVGGLDVASSFSPGDSFKTFYCYVSIISILEAISSLGGYP